MSFFDQVKQSLIEILLVLQSLNPLQREALVRFERCDIDPTQQNLTQLIRTATEEQMEHLVRASQYETEHQPLCIDESISFLTKPQITSFGCIFRLLLLQETLYKYFSTEEIFALVEICRLNAYSADLQLRLLQQFQQFLSGILPETLETIHDRVKEAIHHGHEPNKFVFQLLESCQDQSLLAQPLSQLLSQDLTIMLHIQEHFPKLQPLQLVQLVRLMQMENQWNILEIRQLLSPDGNAWMGLEGIIENDETDTMDTMDTDNDENSFSLTMLEQPPERTVYKRCLKPNPTVLVKTNGRQPTILPGESLCIVPVLCRFDTNEPVPYVSGNSALATNVGSTSVFKRLKVEKTSKQVDDTLFYIKFELRKTDGRKQSEALAEVQSKPFTVVSHSSLLKIPNALPTATEVVPTAGSTQGGTRVVILGSNFEDTPTLLVRFDNVTVVPEFHSPGTLICITPRHIPAQVSVNVANNAKDFGKSTATFTFEESQQTTSLGISQVVDGNITPLTQSEMENLFGDLNADIALTEELLSSGFSPYEPIHFAAALGKREMVEHLLTNRKVSPNCTDSKGNNALYWALYNGYDMLVPFVRAGIDINHVNNNGTSLLHLAASISPQLVAKLIYVGAWINCIDDEGRTPLHIAAINGKLETIKILLRCGAFINAQDNEGETPLHYAVRENRADVVKLLLAEGISINNQNDDGETALHIAISSSEESVLQPLLQNSQCNVNISDNTGASALLLATERGLGSSWVETLIQRGSNIHQKDKQGKAPIDAASMDSQQVLIRLLMTHGAKYSEACDSPPMHTRSFYSHPGVVSH